MKRSLIIIVAAIVACATVVHAQRSDSLSCDYNHSFELKGAVVPTLLVASGSLIAGVDRLHKNIDIPIQQWSQSDGHPSYPHDDYAQYAPMLAVPTLKLCGLESKHNWRDLASLMGGSVVLATVFSNGLKNICKRERPYGNVYNSFPSGHTITAFMGAEILRREYGQEYPGIAIVGYAIATGVGCMRVYNNRHWASDVLAGAGFGILSASLMYWIAPYLRF